MTATIAILVPVLGRPERALPLAQSAAHGTDVPYRLVFLCSPEDGAQIDACQLAGDTIVVDWPAGPGDYARKINHGYRHTTEPWIFTAADDLVFHPGWARAVLQTARSSGGKVIGTQDGWNGAVTAGKHSTHSLVERSYVDTEGSSWDGPGVLLHEGYDHQYVDTELVALARDRGVFVMARDAYVEHLHPMAHKSRMDATYRKGLAKGREDGRLYDRRRRLYLSA